ncbi:hypothetical protein JW887_01010 [Candidatus Dojkabacteria bacterium]|nr:hypothetical protein [Candidatus Dojkabacteria bacterium]
MSTIYPNSEYESNESFYKSKADWLYEVRKRVKQSVVDDFIVFNYAEWDANSINILGKIQSHFPPDNKLIIRSSAIGEDHIGNSLAGALHSEHGMLSSDRVSIRNAIVNVTNSFNKKGRKRSYNDEIIVQKFVEDVLLSGVIITYDLWCNFPYYIITYDNDSKRTNTVTSGQAGKTIRIPRGIELRSIKDLIWKKVIQCAKEIESIFDNSILDIEFALTVDEDVHIFQVRELTTNKYSEPIVEKLPPWPIINNFQDQLCELLNRSNHLPGEKTILTDMSDWNPAEMLGDLPRPLDTSIYRYLITKSAWNKARTSIGYANVQNSELMLTLGHKPYIDARVSINSLTPSSVPLNIRDFLVNYGIDKISMEPEIQDKIEFEVAFSCFDLQVDHRFSDLRKAGLKEVDVKILRQSLLNITNDILTKYSKMIGSDLRLIQLLNKSKYTRHHLFKNTYEYIDEVKNNLDKCIKYGIVPFSRLARLAFIGLALMRSFRVNDLLPESEYDDFLRSITTIAKDVSAGWRNLSKGVISHEKFIEQFGHLRPRTYDITSPRYSQYPQDFWAKLTSKIPQIGFNYDRPELIYSKKINTALKSSGIEHDSSVVFDFARKAIESREYAKFVFSKYLSDSLEILSELGDKIGFSRIDMAFLTIDEIFSLLGNEKTISSDMTNKIHKKIETKKGERTVFSKIALPPILRDMNDLILVSYGATRPNFVTSKKIQASAIYVQEINDIYSNDISGKLVLLDRADPGFDCIFEYFPAGLITKFGGAGSHMTIRCGEFGLPAAIGCGESLFNILTKSNIIIMDCEKNIINPVKYVGS